jgi:hypothetical protein
VATFISASALALRLAYPLPSENGASGPEGVWLLVAAIVLAASYFWDTGAEIDMLMDAGEAYLQRLPRNILLAVVGFVAGLAFLIYTSSSPLWFGIVLATLKVLEFFGAAKAKREIQAGVAGLLRLAPTSIGYRRGVVLSTYYFRWPWNAQLILELAVVLVGVFVAALGALGFAGPAPDQAITASALILIGGMGLNELLAFRWRRLRDDAWEAIP